MKKLALVPMHQENLLPKWSAPKNLGDAAIIICRLGRNMHEHAYLVGRNLLWVKTEVGHGKFRPWLEKNVWFKERTARRMMRFAARCIKAGELSEYHPVKTVIMADLPKTKPREIESDPRPPESRLFFDVAHRIEETFAMLTQEQKNDFVETMKDLIKQLEKRIEEAGQ